MWMIYLDGESVAYKELSTTRITKPATPSLDGVELIHIVGFSKAEPTQEEAMQAAAASSKLKGAMVKRAPACPCCNLEWHFAKRGELQTADGPIHFYQCPETGIYYK